MFAFVLITLEASIGCEFVKISTFKGLLLVRLDKSFLFFNLMIENLKHSGFDDVKIEVIIGPADFTWCDTSQHRLNIFRSLFKITFEHALNCSQKLDQVVTSRILDQWHRDRHDKL